ncbi:SHOCT domain-containing protein [Fibrella sp. ES10-3-2-2]|nr:hypothetical protein A6C57_00435 [Fibrella sp. ES10-3-2-2]
MFRFTLFSLVFGFSCLACFGQTTSKPKVYIAPASEKMEGFLAVALNKTNTWDIVDSPDQSNVTIKTILTQSLGIAKATLVVIDSQTGADIWQTEAKRGASTIYNNFSPKRAAIEKAVDYLEEHFDKRKIDLSHSGAGTVTTNPVSKGSTADELIKLKQLLDSGAISKEEYESLKKKLL